MPAWVTIIAIFAPLVAAAVAGFGNRKLGDRGAQIVTCGAMVLAAACSIAIFCHVALGHNTYTITLMHWLSSGDLSVNWALQVDTLTAVMLVVVNGVSSMVHLYSVGYMAEDKSVPRFMAYLSLFTFFMLMLVTSDNLLQLFFGWEGVGLASYLLINFWYEKPSANAAAIKAFLVNRVGDFGFALGIFACFVLFGTIEFAGIFEKAASLKDAQFNFLGFEVPALTTTCLLLFIGAMGKSAQLGLHTWLPDAMEGPTPVSALIHAATMVTAGVFMVARLSPLFEYAPDALMVVAVVGALTAIVAATIGLTQFDIKRVIAYSTMSQLGYMFFALGVGAYPAAIFHLMTHAFFKALLFLGAGSVIHALSGEQDMRKMGGIAKTIPYTYGLMWVGSLALAGIGIPGVIGMAGFYSKDIILESAWASHVWFGQMAYWLGVAGAFMTAFYSWRLLIMTFHGTSRADHHTLEHAHESPWIMLGPLMPLAAGAIAAGFLAYDLFVGHHLAEFWGRSILMLGSAHGEGAESHTVIDAAHHVETWVKYLPLVAAVSGIGLAYVFYSIMPALPGVFTRTFAPIHKLFYNKYYFDELYDFLFVQTAHKLGFAFWQVGDNKIIDGLGPDGVAKLVQKTAARVSKIQTGYVYHYAFAVVIGLLFFLCWFGFIDWAMTFAPEGHVATPPPGEGKP